MYASNKAIAEIKKVAKNDALLAAEGALVPRALLSAGSVVCLPIAIDRAVILLDVPNRTVSTHEPANEHVRKAHDDDFQNALDR